MHPAGTPAPLPTFKKLPVKAGDVPNLLGASDPNHLRTEATGAPWDMEIPLKYKRTHITARAVKHWKGLSREVVESLSWEMFRTHQDMLLGNLLQLLPRE